MTADALGSSTFGVLVGLGLPWLIAGLAGAPPEFPGASSALTSQLVFLAVSTLILLVGLAVSRWTLTRVFGIVLISVYLVYVVFCILDVYIFEPE